MFPVIVCIAKKEHDYIKEFIQYHLALGFQHVYLYDNEDTPSYETFLSAYKDRLTVVHMPFNNFHKGIQYIALDHFIENYLFKTEISHVAHIDVDEFIALKKHPNIGAFIEEYIVGNCEGIGMNWRYFGSNGLTEKGSDPVTKRFTMCGSTGNQHVKTLFKKDHFKNYNTVHDVTLSQGHIKATNGAIIVGPFNNDIDLEVIQLNHYKCKTLPEFRSIRQRQRADIAGKINEDVDADFAMYNVNEVEDLTACRFYQEAVVLPALENPPQN